METICPTCCNSFSMEAYVHHLPVCYLDACEKFNIQPRCVCTSCKGIVPHVQYVQINDKRIATEGAQNDSLFHQLPKEILLLILKPFHYTIDSLFLRLVCKEWSSLIPNRYFHLSDLACYYSRQGNLTALKYLEQLSIYSTSHLFSDNVYQHMMAGAARIGNIEILEWASKDRYRKILHYSNGYPYLQRFRQLGELVYDEACTGGNLEVIEWLENNNCHVSEQSICIAARHGYEKILDFLLMVGTGEITYELKEEAAFGGHFEIVKKYYSDSVGESLARYGAQYGNIEFIKWLQDRRELIDLEDCGNYALKFGQLETIKWLQTQGWACPRTACDLAAVSGSIDVVQWAKSNGSYCSEKTVIKAAKNGHISLIKWLRENGCPWSAQTTQKVALKCQGLQVLKWLIENNCPLEIQRNSTADGLNFPISSLDLVRKGNFKVIMYLKQYGLYLDPACYTCFKRHWKRNLWFSEWLYENGCPLDVLLTEVNDSFYDNILEWIKAKTEK